MSQNPAMDKDLRKGCSLKSKAGQSRSHAQDSGAQLLSYIATHPLQPVINLPS